MPDIIRVPKKTVFLWQLRATVVFSVFEALFFYLCVISLWFLILPIVLLFFWLFSAFFLIPRHIKSYEIEICNGNLFIRRGFIVKAEYILPVKAVVYTGAFSSPAARKMGLSALCLRAVGAFLLIPEISQRDAGRIIRGGI